MKMEMKSVKHALKKSKSCPQDHTKSLSGNQITERAESAFPLKFRDSNNHFTGTDTMLPSVQQQQKSKSSPSQLSSSIGSTYSPTSPGPSPFSLASTNSAKKNSRSTKYGTPRTTDLLKSPYLQPIMIVTNPFIIGSGNLRKRKSKLSPTVEEQNSHPQQTRKRSFHSNPNPSKSVNPRFPTKKIEKLMSISRKLPVSSLNCEITLRYVGGRLSASVSDLFRHDVCVYQQHCGGNPVIVYHGSLLRGETFNFKSRRHASHFFSITLYVDGLLNQRVSACCEYKHRQGSKLGGSTGHFLLVSVKGSFPCYRCQMTKPTTFNKGVTDSHVNDKIASKISELSVLETSDDCDSSSDSKEYDDDFEDERTEEAATSREVTEITHHQIDEITECDNLTAINDEPKEPDAEKRTSFSEPENEDRPVTREITDQKADDDIDKNRNRSQEQNELEIKDLMSESQRDPAKADSDSYDGRASPSSTDQDGNTTEDDDANASITSSAVSSEDDDDDDIVYQADVTNPSFSDSLSAGKSDWQHCNERAATGQHMIHDKKQQQWTIYRESGQQFDSSDEEGYVDNSSKPVTVHVDVHACEQIEYATGNSQIVT